MVRTSVLAIEGSGLEFRHGQWSVCVFSGRRNYSLLLREFGKLVEGGPKPLQCDRGLIGRGDFQLEILIGVLSCFPDWASALCNAFIFILCC